MTDQVNLGKIWAVGGGNLDPGDIKYELGWIAEIPTYQNFNFVLGNHSTNLLVKAEQHSFDWQVNIDYKKGASVDVAGIVQYAQIANIGNDPVTDTLKNFWRDLPVFGADSIYSSKVGLLVNNPATDVISIWDQSVLTLFGETSCNMLMAVNNIAYDNLLLSNNKGSLQVSNVTNAIEPTNGSTNSAFNIYHEGFKPTQGDVVGTIPDSPANGLYYGRRNSGWEDLSNKFGELNEPNSWFSTNNYTIRPTVNGVNVLVANDFSGNLANVAYFDEVNTFTQSQILSSSDLQFYTGAVFEGSMGISGSKISLETIGTESSIELRARDTGIGWDFKTKGSSTASLDFIQSTSGNPVFRIAGSAEADSLEILADGYIASLNKSITNQRPTTTSVLFGGTTHLQPEDVGGTYIGNSSATFRLPHPVDVEDGDSFTFINYGTANDMEILYHVAGQFEDVVWSSVNDGVRKGFVNIKPFGIIKFTMLGFVWAANSSEFITNIGTPL